MTRDHVADATDDAGRVTLTRDGVVATICLDRPAKRNAISDVMWRQMADAVRTADNDTKVRVIVVTGAGRAFAAGSDIAEFGSVADDPAAASAAADVIHASERVLHRAAKPTLAKIRGACVGAGCGIALCCDFRFADSTAQFGITPARLGLVYSLADTKRLVDVVGGPRARDILLTGRLFDADVARDMNLIDCVVPPEDLDATVTEYVARLVEASAFSQRAMKEQIQAVLDGATDDTAETRRRFAAAIGGADFKEGHAAFMAKRRPVFPP